MRFDDRLTTVLAQGAGDPRDRAVRWRQLVDLVAHAGAEQSPLFDSAIAEIAAEVPHVDADVRAAAARSITSPGTPLALLSIFAADTVEVAAPLLAAARLDEAALRQLYEAAGAGNRRFLSAMHPQLAGTPARQPVPPPTPPVQSQPQPAAADAEEPIPSISDLVARIERIRQARDDEPLPPAEEPQAAPVAGDAALFRWECSPSGEIAWVDGAPRGALIGRSLAQPWLDESVDPAIPQAFARRASFHEARLSLAGEGAMAGEWKISGAPAFEPSDGRFAGYRGVATRDALRGKPSAGGAGGAHHDSLRELVHELKTPLNAIIGFAEIIDGQYFGPANDHYRARAAEIAAQARLLVAAIDDLDLAARLQSGREPATEPVPLGQLIHHLAPELQDRAADRGAIFEVAGPVEGTFCAIHPGIAEQLVRRFCEAVIDLTQPGERLEMALQMLRGSCALSLPMPGALHGRDAEALLAGASPRGDNDEPDPMFWLRLVRSLARLTGGELVIADGHLALVLAKAGA